MKSLDQKIRGMWPFRRVSPSIKLKQLAQEESPSLSSIRSAVTSGANVCMPIGCGFLTTLHLLLLRSMSAEVKVCMESPKPIDFTVKDFSGLTPFHYVCNAKTPEMAQLLLTVMIERVKENRIGDRVNFSAKDNSGKDFLSYAAEHHILHIIWPVVKDLSFFSDCDSSLRIHAEVTQQDWELLGSNKKFFEPLNGFVEANTELIELCYQEEEPSSDDIKNCLDRGANPSLKRAPLEQSVLHLFVENACAEFVNHCMSTFAPIDFAVVDANGRTPLMVLNSRGNYEMAKTILSVMLKRIAQKRPDDQICWVQKDNNEQDFLSSMAEQQLLHVAWPLVKQIPFFTDRLAKGHVFPLKALVVTEDFQKLSEEDQKCFSLICGSANAATVALTDESLSIIPNVEVVKQSVACGADVCYKRKGWKRPVLHQFILRDSTDCLHACLTTKNPVDWTLTDEEGCTPLHLVCIAENTDILTEMLSMIVSRIQERQTDIIDWSQKDRKGLDFLSYAVENNVLNVVWNIVKHLPFFNQPTPFVIDAVALSGDWEKLSEEDQQCFTLTKGCVEVKDDEASLQDTPLIGLSAVYIQFKENEVLQWNAKRRIRSTDWQEKIFGRMCIGEVESGEHFCVKVLGFSAGDMMGLKITESEAKMRYSLTHKHILQCHHYQVVNNPKMLYDPDRNSSEIQVFMDLCEDRLDILLWENPKYFTISRVRNFVRQILLGLSYLHSMGIPHRDVRPENIMVDDDNVVKLLNFGCTESFIQHHWKTNFRLTPSFCPPEVFEEEEEKLPVNHYLAADIWSLGCTILTLLGRRPWGKGLQESSVAIRLMHSTGLPSGVPKNCPPMLHNFLNCCFERHPEKRWSANQLLKHPWITCREHELEKISSL